MPLGESVVNHFSQNLIMDGCSVTGSSSLNQGVHASGSGCEVVLKFNVMTVSVSPLLTGHV